MRSIVSSLLALTAIAASGQAAAQALSLSVPPGPSQMALALRAESGGIRARVCAAAAGCTPEGGTMVAVPDEVKARLSRMKPTIVLLKGGRLVAHVEVPGEEKGEAWRAIIAAPLVGKPSEPIVIWSGATGVLRGEHGEERSHAVVMEALPEGGTRVLIGEHRADVTMCGRPTLVGTKEIDPETLDLVRASSVQNLSAADRAGATKIAAARATGDAPRASARLLRATAASSALGKKLAAITDGDPATAWSENKTGDGRGEFVSMSSAEEVGIVALDVIVKPTEDVDGGAAPKRVYVATESKLFEVTMPEDAWKQAPGARYTVKLPAEVKTSCLAIVLDEAYASSKANVRVTIAEIEARTAFDNAVPEALAGALAGGSARSKAAAAMLARSGEPGMRAAMAMYDKLDDGGKQLAAEVIDAAPCKDQAPFFAARFAAKSVPAPGKKPASGDVDPELSHARDRLRRCGRAAADALAKILAEGEPRAKVAAADELSALAPDLAVPILLDAMARADDGVRRDLRAALARASKSRRALPALAEAITGVASRSEIVAIDLLRAVGPSLGEVEGAPQAFASMIAKSTSFRARYLLQAPASELARAGDRVAEGFLRDALRKDQDAHVRARAAAAVGSVPALAGDLAAAIDDADPRVREAAIAAIAEARSRGEIAPAAGLGATLAKRLGDDWTFVRAGAAQALGALPAEPAIDTALAAALEDRSPEVRGRALDGLGAHHATAHLDAIRGRQDDDGETLEVRARAILALGSLCDTKSIGTWTTLALIARAPINERDRRLGGAAVAALGELHPKDLAQRLAPLLDKDASTPVREMAKAALAAKGTCK